MWQQGWSSEPCDMHKYESCASYLARSHRPRGCLCVSNVSMRHKSNYFSWLILSFLRMPMIKTLWHYVTVGMVEWALWYAQIWILCILLGWRNPSRRLLVCVQCKYEALCKITFHYYFSPFLECRWLKPLWHHVTAGMVEWALWYAQIQILCILLGSLALSLWLLVCVSNLSMRHKSKLVFMINFVFFKNVDD